LFCIFIILLINNLILVPEILKKNYKSTKTILDITLNETNEKIKTLTNALINVIEYNENDFKLNIVVINNNNDRNNKDDNETIDKKKENNISNYDYLKEILTMFRQHEIYLNELLTNLNNTNNYIDKYIKLYREQLDELHATVQFKIAIPCELVFVIENFI